MSARKAVPLLLLTVLVSPLALADQAAPFGPPAPALQNAPRSSSLQTDIPRSSTAALAERSSNMSIAPGQITNQTPPEQGRPAADIPLDSRVGLHMMTDGERPALEYRLSETGSLRLRGHKGGAKLVMIWKF
ncbi:MAG: hypothetical protein V4488_26405 [Pseudomonadota bacterium]